MQIPYGESEVIVEVFVSSFALGSLGDMPQQSECAGFLHQNAAFGCRSCLISSKEYGNLDYDINKRGRCDNVTLYIRTKALDMPPTKRNTQLRGMGINEQSSPVLRSLSPAIDICRSFPPDPLPCRDVWNRAFTSGSFDRQPAAAQSARRVCLRISQASSASRVV
jgi:hypothetical protein